MRFNGQACVGQFTRTVELRRPDGTSVPLVIKPLPLGFHGRMRERGVCAPAPPARVARDAAGKPLRDARGMAVLMANERDAEYLAAVERHNQRVAALVIAEGLRGDTNVRFEAVERGKGTGARGQGTENIATHGDSSSRNTDLTAFADAITEELAEAGWSDGDVLWLCREILALSNLLDDHVREAQGNFPRVWREPDD